MKESSSTHNKMIDRNWVLKRKRKRISCGLDLSKKKEGISLECSGINPSLKHNTNLPRPRQKIKGNDGYYYECVECDLGGKLLCCDCCPRTYHLECLKPPLKSPPLGKWQCPNCCDPKDSVKLLSLSHVDPVSKRARTKLTGGKSKTEHGLSGSEKSSLVGQSSILGKYKPANKGKSILSHIPSSTKKKSDYTHLDLSTSTKSSRSSGGGNRDGMLVPCGKKLSSAFDWKYSSPRKEVQSPVKNLDAEASDSSPDRKSNICENGSLGNELIPSFSQSIQKTRRRQKDKRGDKKKKSISEKDKHLVVTIRKPSMKKSSSRTEIGGPRPKRGSMVQQVPASMEDPRVQREPQGSPDRTSKPLRVVAEQENEVEKMLECDITFLDEAQQVDRILGCRLQGIDTTFSSHTAQIEVTSTPEHTESEKNSINLTGPGISNAEDVKDMPENKCDHPVSEIGPVTDVHNNVIGFGDHADKASKTRGCIQGSENINLLKDSVDYHDASKKDDKLLKEIGNPGNIEVNIEKPLENSDMELATEDIQNNLEQHTPCSFTITSKPEDINGVTTESQPNIMAEKRTSEGKVVDYLPEDKVNVAYEFLVKWVGQSNIHNSWVPESQLKILAKRKLENYKAKYGTTVINICQEQWTQPQRVIGLHDSKDDQKEAFIKWSGLPYVECTWETLDEPVVKKFPHLISEFNQFESQALVNAKDSSGRASGDVQEVLPLVEQPRELKGGSLFPHQLEALNWLRKCWHKSKNVILADEMGLGKTVSACAFISSLYFEFKAKLPCLVLVPLSTMPNWLAEFSLWAPHLNVVEYHGCAKARSIIRQYEWHASDPNGNKITAAYKFNVLLTTYEMVLADASHLRGVSWEVLVVDEGHRLKNSGSKLFSMLNTFSFQHRILLTGTPLQNNIGEMYNLLNFLQPVSFPSLSAFEEKFNDLTTAEKVEELKKLVAPHMLRRLKKDAMQNIPPKTERMVPVELTSIQAEYYRAMLTKNYQILRNIGKGVAQQSMLNIVMQLRKVCNHPYLIPGTEPDSGSVEFLHEMRIKASGKLTLLHSMLTILHKEGHRILIFSQMTKLLDILEDYLTIEYGPKTFERVDGSVSVADRQLAISRFNQDKTRFVFLLSTRSCGLGINLATADTVIIYDSDFNPHADIQAMNRAHRIGQSNRLLVYRLVVRASVEERILQLAKRKLMLDQLFVNKSETQKEVEDILRWGTEELFSDSDGMGANDQNETCNIKTEAVADGDLRHRRRAGGLGDVYQDRCTDGGNRNAWDESAILKLLDRSNLQAGALESTDVDLENDMLGSVKSLEWNDDLTEEQGGGESLPNIVGDGGVQTSDAKEDNLVTNTEENEWDRLLRVRWEKYQSEEEAALGRGKRLRKAVSYKESFATIPCDALSESGNEEDEPEPEYTPAGRAFKAKFAKLRARQKERLAQRRITDLACSTENQSGADVQPQVVPPVKEAEGLDAGKPVKAVSDHVSSADLGESKMIQTSEALNLRDGSTRVGKFPKHGHRRFHLDPSARPPETLSPDMLLPPRKLHSTGFANSLPNSDHLPVLGLCAPNASLLDPKSRKFHSFLGLPMPSFEERSSGMNLQEVPSPSSTVPVPSYIANLNDGANTMDASLLPELFSGTSDRNTKNSIPGNYFPFDPCPPATSQGKGPELKSHSDILPSLSVDGKMENVNVPLQDLPSLPMLPNFNQHMNENIMQKHVRDLLPTLALGQMQPTLSPLPENHRKVLDSIMMRTGSGSSKLSKKRQKVETWSEDELDSLWIGVRRHGRGNWDAMLRDSKLKFSKYRSSDDLSARWAEEQLKILDGPILPTPKSMKSTFPSISDGMMTRALISSRFATLGMEPPKFHSHLTDIQLGCGDLMAGPPSSDQTDHFSSLAKSCPSFLPWQPELFSADFVAGPSDRSTSSNLPVEKTFQHNSLSCSNLNSVGMKCSVSPDSLKGEDVLCANKYRKLPSLLDSSLSMLQDFQVTGESKAGLPCGPDKKLIAHQSKKDDAGSSNKNKLPHWLREAVNVPPITPTVPVLPPTVSAIAYSVRLLYGSEKSTFPTFTVPGPPPRPPKDPRKRLKKKGKLHKLRQVCTDTPVFPKTSGVTSSSSVHAVPPLTASTSGTMWADPCSSAPFLNLNLLNSPSALHPGNQCMKSEVEIAPSPEAINLVDPCMAPGPSFSPAPCVPSPSDQISDPAAKASEDIEQSGKGLVRDLKGLRGKRKASKSSLRGCWGKLTEEHIDPAESGDSGKTDSYARQTEQAEVQGIASEETVSVDHQSENEL